MLLNSSCSIVVAVEIIESDAPCSTRAAVADLKRGRRTRRADPDVAAGRDAHTLNGLPVESRVDGLEQKAQARALVAGVVVLGRDRLDHGGRVDGVHPAVGRAEQQPPERLAEVRPVIVPHEPDLAANARSDGARRLRRHANVDRHLPAPTLVSRTEDPESGARDDGDADDDAAGGKPKPTKREVEHDGALLQLELAGRSDH